MKRTGSSFSITLLAALLIGVLLSSAVSSPALAQTSVSLSGGMNLLWEEFWGYLPVGFNAAAVGQIPVTRWMLLDPTVSYRIYPLWTDPVGLWTDLQAKVVSAEPLQQLWLGLALRLQLPTDSHKTVPFVDLGVGYEFERAGRVTQDWGPGLYTTESNPMYLHTWVYTMAAGALIPLSSRFSLQPALFYHAGGRGRNYGLITVDILYDLSL